MLTGYTEYADKAAREAQSTRPTPWCAGALLPRRFGVGGVRAHQIDTRARRVAWDRADRVFYAAKSRRAPIFAPLAIAPRTPISRLSLSSAQDLRAPVLLRHLGPGLSARGVLQLRQYARQRPTARALRVSHDAMTSRSGGSARWWCHSPMMCRTVPARSAVAVALDGRAYDGSCATCDFAWACPACRRARACAHAHCRCARCGSCRGVHSKALQAARAPRDSAVSCGSTISVRKRLSGAAARRRPFANEWVSPPRSTPQPAALAARPCLVLRAARASSTSDWWCARACVSARLVLSSLNRACEHPSVWANLWSSSFFSELPAVPRSARCINTRRSRPFCVSSEDGCERA